MTWQASNIEAHPLPHVGGKKERKNVPCGKTDELSLEEDMFQWTEAEAL